MQWEIRGVLNIAYKRLARRPHTVKQLQEIYTKRDIPESLQQEAIKKLVQLKLVNDVEFAKSFIRSRNLLKPRPVRVLRLELLKKGVEKDDIERALDEESVDETAGAREILRRQTWKYRNLEGNEKRQKQLEFLMRKGFTYEVAKRALE